MGLRLTKLNYLELPGLDISVDFSRATEKGSQQPILDVATQDRLLDEMVTLEAGGVANASESRQVGHYWLRDPDLAPEPEIRDAIANQQKRIFDFVVGLLGRFQRVIHLGIGGSALGPQLLVDCFEAESIKLTLNPVESRSWSRQIDFIDNADVHTLEACVSGAGITQPRLADTLIVVASKSGGTLEVMAALAGVEQKAREVGDNHLPDHAVALTGPGSSLDQRADEEGWLARFAIPEWVGGRTSIFGAPGLLTLGLLDGHARLALDGETRATGFLEGGRRMDALTRSRDHDTNPALRLALCWHAAFQAGVRTLVFLPYCDRLGRLGSYLQQLIMESLGKDGHGFNVLGHKGTTDQHALIQHLCEGPNDSLITFIEVLEQEDPIRPLGGSYDVEVEDGVHLSDIMSAFLAGTRAALSDAGRPCVTLTLRRLDEASLGALIALIERAVGFYASLVGINAYDQPGVEAGKRSAARFLKLQRELLAALTQTPNLSREALVSRLGASLPDVRHVLNHLVANGRVVASDEGYSPAGS